MKVAVIGLGLIGGSVALDLKTRKFATSVVGFDSNPTNARLAKKLKLVDQVLSLKRAIHSADLIVLAVPVDMILKLLPKILDQMGDRAVVTDVGSTKQEICKAVIEHPRRSQYVASHPMAGTENSGPAAAIRGLFDQKTAVICDRWSSQAWAVERVESFYDCLKMRIVSMASSEHDYHVAFVSHLSHVSSFVLANTVLEKEKNVNAIFDLAGGGFESTVRLAKSSPQMWSPIFLQNRVAVLSAIDAYIESLEQFRKLLKAKNSGHLQATMQNANRIRKVLDNLKGQKNDRRRSQVKESINGKKSK